MNRHVLLILPFLLLSGCRNTSEESKDDTKEAPLKTALTPSYKTEEKDILQNQESSLPIHPKHVYVYFFQIYLNSDYEFTKEDVDYRFSIPYAYGTDLNPYLYRQYQCTSYAYAALPEEFKGSWTTQYFTNKNPLFFDKSAISDLKTETVIYFAGVPDKAAQ